MGRIKTTQIKRIGKKLFGLYGSQFTENFEENKVKVSGFVNVQSKKLRNIISGYVTRLAKSHKDE